MTIQEAAAELDITQNYTRRLVRAGKLDATKTKTGAWNVKGTSVRKRRRLMVRAER